jgi:hypothetical protein
MPLCHPVSGTELGPWVVNASLVVPVAAEGLIEVNGSDLRR